MKVGDLVKFEPIANALVINGKEDLRRTGAVIGIENNKQYGILVEVLWNTGCVGHVLERRVTVINER